MVLEPNILILAGWCKVFHHSTEYLIIGIFINPTITIRLEILSALSVLLINLCANINKGRRPNFFNAADHQQASLIYKKFCDLVQQRGIEIHKGQFGSTMNLGLINDGPFTIMVDSCNR